MTKEDQFEAFWRAYPRRISKGAARTAFAKAIGKTTLDNMIRAIGDYIANKPTYQDYKHPSTWLNQECWDDEWSVPVPVQKFERKRTLADAREDLGRYLGNADGPWNAARH